jgi:hypothetical protein
MRLRSGRKLTVTEIRRRRCFRCRRRGYAHWSICADDNRPRVLCIKCDIALNKLVLRWMRFSRRRDILHRYVARVVWKQV